jgi:uncharacterized protein (TIGR03085 family)
MPHHARDERHALSATLRSAGPDAPTLCGDWTTKELAAHLALRERSLVEMAGRLPVERVQRYAEDDMRAYAANESYERLVAQVDAGPSWKDSPVAAVWSLPPVREYANLLEYVVHHEDVRRTGSAWAPRTLPVAFQEAVWKRLPGAARLTARSLKPAVRLVWPSYGSLRAGKGKPAVTVVGDPVELAMFVFGRQRVAIVDYAGDAADIEIVSGARIGI